MALLALTCAAPAYAANPKVNMREGQWRIDMEMTLPGKGPGTNDPMFRELCLDASNLTQMVMPQNPFCKGNVIRQDVGSMDWKMTCSQGGTDATSRAHFEFTGEKFAGAILTTAPRFGMEFKTIIRGRYMGACPVGQAPAKSAAPAQQAPGTTAFPEKPTAQLPPYKP